MTSPLPPDILKLRRERDYYFNELNRLGARFSRATEEQSKSSREAERSKAVLRLVREIYRLDEHDGSPSEIIITMLETVSSSALADRAVLLREEPLGSGSFKLLEAIGFGEDRALSEILLTRPPDFAFTAGDGPGRMEINATAMTNYLGVRFILWSYDKPTGFAILIGNRQEGNTSRPYEDSDRDLIETSLSAFLDALVRKEAVRGPPLPSPPAASEIEASPGVVRRETGLSVSDVQEQIGAGGRILGVIVVERFDGKTTRYAPYFATTWRRGYSVMKTHDNKNDRAYKDLDRLLQFVRADFGFDGPITIYTSGAGELHSIPGVKGQDLERGSRPDGTTP